MQYLTEFTDVAMSKAEAKLFLGLEEEDDFHTLLLRYGVWELTVTKKSVTDINALQGMANAIIGRIEQHRMVTDYSYGNIKEYEEAMTSFISIWFKKR